MGSAELQEFYLVIVSKSIFSLRNFQIRATYSCKRVDLLMHRNRVFRMRNAETWAVLSCNEVDLLILRNRLFQVAKR